MTALSDIDVEELQSLYQWVDTIPLSRPKRNIARDFSDGVLCAEIVHHYLPKVIDLHNYSSASGVSQKIYNWETLNAKVFRKLGFTCTRQDFDAIASCVPGAIEKLLQLLQVQIAKYHARQQKKAASQSPDNFGTNYTSNPSPSHSNSSSRLHHRSGKAAVGPGSTASALTHAAHGGRSRNGSPAVNSTHSKDRYIQELKEANDILDTKVRKLEQLVRLKDAKIQTLQAKLQAMGLESNTRIYT